jgi:hypothetical protein
MMGMDVERQVFLIKLLQYSAALEAAVRGCRSNGIFSRSFEASATSPSVPFEQHGYVRVRMLTTCVSYGQ